MTHRNGKMLKGWFWLILMATFIVIVIGFTFINHLYFKESIVGNFNQQQFVLISSMEAVIEEHIDEAVQNIRTIAQQLHKKGDFENSGDILSLVYENHQEDFLRIDIINSNGRSIDHIPKDTGKSNNIIMIQDVILKYTGEGDQLLLTRRCFFDHQSAIGIIQPFTLQNGERFFSVGFLRIESFLEKHFSSWKNSDASFILANSDGEILSMLNVDHDLTDSMSKGNIRSLDKTCLSCHKPDDFSDINQSVDRGVSTSSIFYSPDKTVKNRNTKPIELFQEIWSWSASTPYQTIQGTIDKNYKVKSLFAIFSLLILGMISFVAFRANKKEGLIIAEAENLRKISETSAALSESENRFKTLFDDSVDAIFFTTKEGRFIDLNRSGLELFGYTRDEILDINIKKIYANPRDRKVFQQAIEKLGFVKDYELELRKKDGTRIYCKLNASIRSDDTGRVIGYQGIIHDITKSKETEDALKQAAELDKERIKAIQESYDTLRANQNATMNIMEDLTQEIEQRKIITEDLKSSQEYSQSLIDSSLDMIIAVDKKRRITEFNRAAEEAFGYEKESILGKHINILYADANQGRKIHKMTIEKGRHLHEVLNKRKNGDVFPALLASSTLKNSNGEIIGMMGVSRDITEQKRIKEELEDSEKKYRLLIENAIEAIYIAQDNKLTFANPMVSYILGYPHHEILSRPFTDFIHPEDKEMIIENYLKRIKGEKVPNNYEFRVIDKKGNVKWLSILSVNIEWNDSPATLNFSSDITERKNTEREIKSLARFPAENPNPIMRIDREGILLYANKPAFSMPAEWKLKIGTVVPEVFQNLIKKTKDTIPYNEDIACGDRIFSATASLSPDMDFYDIFASDITARIELEEKRKLALHEARRANKVKNLFLANMSHEIRTPLNTILGFTNLVEEMTRDFVDEEGKKFFTIINSSGARLIHTVHEILDISQIEAGTYIMNIEEFNLVTVVQTLVQGMEMRAKEKKLSLSFHFTRKEMFIRADQNGISQSINNIIDNAIKYTEKGEINLILKRKSKRPVLTIKDTGIGMSRKYLNRLFDTFTQESEGYTKKFQGIGLGMSIVKRHLDLNHVDITVNSTKGKGTTITLIFPSPETGTAEDTKKSNVNLEGES